MMGIIFGAAQTDVDEELVRDVDEGEEEAGDAGEAGEEVLQLQEEEEDVVQEEDAAEEEEVEEDAVLGAEVVVQTITLSLCGMSPIPTHSKSQSSLLNLFFVFWYHF